MGAGRLLVALIKAYQAAVSPLLGPRCRFYPSCSEYAARSIGLNGAVVGALDGLGRLLRCHPFHPGGLDEPRKRRILPERFRWKTEG